MPDVTPATLATWNCTLRRAARAATATRNAARPASAKTNPLLLTLLVAVLGGLASSIFGQWYQTYREEKSWRREQHTQALQTALEKALEANVTIEQVFGTSGQFKTAIEADELARSTVRDLIVDLKQAVKEGQRANLHEPVELTTRANQLFQEQAVLEAKLVMLLYQSEMPDAADPEPGAGAGPLQAYQKWSSAAAAAHVADMKAAKARWTEPKTAAEVLRDGEKVSATESQARDQLRTAVRDTCTRAARRLHFFRRYGTGLGDKRAFPEPTLPWLEP